MIFVKACRGEATPRVPVWLMRQAGRYMREYRDVREKYTFLELCKNKDLVTEVTVYAQERIKADAAIIFSDILLITEAFGMPLDYKKGDGPSIGNTIQSESDVKNLKDFHIEESLGYVLEAIRQTKKALKPEIALIGFAGAPFTLASYMIEGSGTKDFIKTKNFMHHHPKAWQHLLEKIADKTAAYLKLQAKAGADVVQLFDSWIGNLTESEYEKYALPYSKRLLDALKGEVLTIHFGTGTAPFLEKFAEAGGDVISVDHHIRLDEAWRRIGPGKALQGNLDPRILLRDLKTIEKHTREVLGQVKGRPGYIFNLGHGVLPETPVENVIALVEMVHGNQ